MINLPQYSPIWEKFDNVVKRILFDNMPIVLKKTYCPRVLLESMLKSAFFTSSKFRGLVSSMLSMSEISLGNPNSGVILIVLYADLKLCV